MGLIYPNKFTYLNTFVIQLAQRCLDNGGPTVLGKISKGFCGIYTVFTYRVCVKTTKRKGYAFQCLLFVLCTLTCLNNFKDGKKN